MTRFWHYCRLPILEPFSCLTQAAQAALLERLASQSQARREATRSAADVAAAQARTASAEAALEGLQDALARVAQETVETEVCPSQ